MSAVVLVVLGAALFVTLFVAYMFDIPQEWASRRRCVAHRGEVAAVLAAPSDHLCDECRERLERIQLLEWAMDRPMPPRSMADPSLMKVIYR